MKIDLASLMNKILNENKKAFTKLAAYKKDELGETRMAEPEDYEEFSEETAYSEGMCYVVIKKYQDGDVEVVSVSKTEEGANKIAAEEKDEHSIVEVQMVQLFE